MVGGRVVAGFVERPQGFYPCWLYGAVESVMAAILLAAAIVAP
jgi:hypothetical protein